MSEKFTNLTKENKEYISEVMNRESELQECINSFVWMLFESNEYTSHQIRSCLDVAKDDFSINVKRFCEDKGYI